MKLTKRDYDFCMKACADNRAKDDEKNHLSYCAAMWAANESISTSDYNYMQALTGGHLSTIKPIFNRKAA